MKAMATRTSPTPATDVSAGTTGDYATSVGRGNQGGDIFNVKIFNVLLQDEKFMFLNRVGPQLFGGPLPG